MSEYNQYITAINKIFDYLAKMKVGWSGQDNLNYIASIEEYKQTVINSLNIFKVSSNNETNEKEDDKEW